MSTGHVSEVEDAMSVAESQPPRAPGCVRPRDVIASLRAARSEVTVAPLELRELIEEGRAP
jgi:hypothetical protein